MNKRRLFSILLAVISISLVLSNCGGGKRSGHRYKTQHYTRVGKVTVPASDVKLVMNDRVQSWIDYFTGNGRDRFGRYMKRAGRYMSLMQSILKEHGLPQDVIYIAMIESGFTAQARSYASAVGFWQFIGSTGRRYGLRIDPYVDERIHFEKSTHAAASYLADLYNEFGDWYLAFAGYNAGEGKIRRAIAMYGTKDFWQLSSRKNGYLRAETKDYVPKFIAAAIIAKNPKKFGFNVEVEKPLDYEKVKVTDQTDYETISKCAGVDYETVTLLNPHLLMGVTPDERGFEIMLPRGKAQKFTTAFAKLPKEQRLAKKVNVPSGPPGGVHVVGKGDTIAKIAKRYGVSSKALMAENGIRKHKGLKRGMKLKIPGVMVASKSAGAAAKTAGVKFSKVKNVKAASLPSAESVAVEDTQVASGQLAAGTDAAAQTGESAGDIVLGGAPGPSDGASVVRYTETGRATNHKVKRGDTLVAIGQKYNVTPEEIKKWNGLTSNKLIVGKNLKVVRDVENTENVVAEVKNGAAKVAVNAGPTEFIQGGEPTSHRTYKVAKGDTVYAVAKKHGISVAELCELNNINRKALLKVGTILKVQKEIGVVTTGNKRSERTVVPPPQASASPGIPGAAKKEFQSLEKQRPAKKTIATTYKVKPGESAWVIAKRNDLTVNELKKMNGGKDLGKLRPGDTIRLVPKKKGG